MKLAPHYSVVAREKDDLELSRKLDVLRTWTVDGIPRVRTKDGGGLVDNVGRDVLEFFPRSLRQFKLWSSDQNSADVIEQFGHFSANGSDTLTKRPSVVISAKGLIAALLQRERAQQSECTRSEVKKLKAELQTQGLFAAVRLSELREQQREIRRLQNQLRSTEEGHKRTETELFKLIDELRKQVQDARAETARLTSTLSKVSPLHAARGD